MTTHIKIAKSITKIKMKTEKFKILIKTIKESQY